MINDVVLVLKGILIGLAISAPIGSVGVLVLRRAMLHGFGAGILTGLGAAVADCALTGAIAFGLTSVAGFFDQWVILCAIAGKLRENASGTWMRRINQGCGILLALIGTLQLALLGFGSFRG